MCGIGLICGNSRELKNNMANIVNSSQKLRGPDNIETLNLKDVTFCHQRLSIVGLDSKYNQPYKWKNFIIVFNGEIYNYLKLASDFSLSKFAQRNDTACIIELVSSIGLKKTLNLIDGMFCFAIYDIKKNILNICTDPFGIKQLYTTVIDNHIIITSSVQAAKNCLLSEGVNLTADQLTMKWQECFNGTPPGHTHLTQISQLVKNSLYQINLNKDDYRLEIDENLLNKKNVYSPQRDTELILEEALIGDVPAGIMLSGGIDSSCLLAKTKSLNLNLKAFILNTKFDNKSGFSIDEVANAKSYAESLNIDSTIINSQGVTKEELEYLFSIIDTPAEVTGALGLLKICKKIKSDNKNIKYIISGIGADEIYFGYRFHSLTLIFSILPNFLFQLIKYSKPFLKFLTSRAKFYLKRRLLLLERFINTDNNYKDAVLHSYELSKECALMWRSFYPLEVKTKFLFLKNFYNSCFNFFLPQLHLPSYDRVSMHYSLELRVPFLQKRILQNIILIIMFSLFSRS